MSTHATVTIPFEAIESAFIGRLEAAMPGIATDSHHAYVIGHHVTEIGLVIEIERVLKEKSNG